MRLTTLDGIQFKHDIFSLFQQIGMIRINRFRLDFFAATGSSSASLSGNKSRY